MASEKTVHICAEFLTAEHKAQVHQLLRIIGREFEKGKTAENVTRLRQSLRQSL
jgi:hypothetical protein